MLSHYLLLMRSSRSRIRRATSFASGPVSPIDVEALYAHSTRVGAFNLSVDDAPARWAEAKRALVDVVASGALSIHVSRTLPLAAAAQAHHALESRASSGKLVLLPITSPG